MRERDKAQNIASTPLHANGIESDTQQPGFGMKLLSTRGASGINTFQSLMEGILSKILALFPISGQTIDGMKDQFAIFMNERLYETCRR
jgi:hypothetical protein